MTDEVVLLRGFVGSVNSPYEYQDGKFVYVDHLPPTCTLQLEGEFNGSNTYQVNARLKHGEKYELVLRPVDREPEKSALSKAIEKIQASPRKFNDEI